MNKITNWLLSISSIIIAICFIIFLTKINIISISFSEPDNVVIAIIGSATAIITILGSILVAQLSSNANAKQQREAESRKIKQDYYNRFIEALTTKLAYIKDSTCTEAIESNQKFCLEANRLPLYASQKVVKFVNDISEGKKASFSELFTLIREDLCSNDYEKFEESLKFNIQIPQLPVRNTK